MGEFDGQAYCAVCRIVLDYETSENGIRWIHPVARAARVAHVGDHEPVPVTTSADDPLLDAVTHCDFCDGPSPSWTYPCADFHIVTGFGSKGDWAACDDCASFIEAKRFMKLARRAAKGRSAMVPALTALYQTFDQNRTGPRYRHRP